MKRKLINKRLLYSARKKRVKGLALYSVLKPETSSDSPSEKSKGVRLVSARAEENQTNPTGSIKLRFHWLRGGKKASRE